MLVLLLLLLMFLLLLVLFLLLFLLFGFFAALRSAGRRSSGENPCTVHPLWLLIPFSRHIPPHPSFAKEKPTEAFLGMIQRDAKQAHCQTEPWKHFVRYFLQNPGHFWWFPTKLGEILTVSPPPSPPFPASSWSQMSLGCWRLSDARVGEGEKYKVNPRPHSL